ncbi:TPA: alpha/beta hydrolase [Aeromonas hydrophila]
MLELLDPVPCPCVVETLFHQFDRPSKLPIRGREQRWLETLTTHQIETPVGASRLYEYGLQDAPAILFVHGWGGYAGMFALLASSLAKRGYRIVLPDLLGHGGSSTDNQCHFAAQLTLLNQVLRDFGPCQHVIGHSLGGFLSTRLNTNDSTLFLSATLLGAPQSLTHAFRHFIAQLQNPVDPGFAEILARRYCAQHALPPSCLTGQGHNFTQNALFVHGNNDHRFESHQARASHQACALPPAQKQLLIDDNLGHLGILYATEIHQAICSFIDHSLES